MDIEIDPLATVAIYTQIRDRIVEGIGRGELHRGDSLAPVRQLAAAFAINPATVAKAYDQLRAEGLVGTNAKSGTFVAADRDTSVPTPTFRADFTARVLTLLAEGRAQGFSADDLLRACGDAVHTLRD